MYLGSLRCMKCKGKKQWKDRCLLFGGKGKTNSLVKNNRLPVLFQCSNT